MAFWKERRVNVRLKLSKAFEYKNELFDYWLGNNFLQAQCCFGLSSGLAILT